MFFFHTFFSARRTARGTRMAVSRPISYGSSISPRDSFPHPSSLLFPPLCPRDRQCVLNGLGGISWLGTCAEIGSTSLTPPLRTRSLKSPPLHTFSHRGTAALWITYIQVLPKTGVEDRTGVFIYLVLEKHIQLLLFTFFFSHSSVSSP